MRGEGGKGRRAEKESWAELEGRKESLELAPTERRIGYVVDWRCLLGQGLPFVEGKS